VRRWLPLRVLLAGTFMIVLDFFIVNVALPSMSTDLHASASAVEWVLAGYGLTLATFLVTAGRLGDRIGRRRMFVIGLGLFTLASVACGAASTPSALIAARLLQGFAAALLSPSVLSLIGVLFRGEDATKALSAYGLTLGLAAVGGQLIGGALIQQTCSGWDGAPCS
jgi:MFS family permease